MLGLNVSGAITAISAPFGVGPNTPQRPGQAAAARGLRAKHPVVIVPGERMGGGGWVRVGVGLGWALDGHLTRGEDEGVRDEGCVEGDGHDDVQYAWGNVACCVMLKPARKHR